MRCRHCITDAPARTQSGAARTLSPWLLDRLRDAFAFAEYVGFVHGGEPLAAPILWDVLRSVRAARGGFPYVAHVLTNGLLLGEAVAARLAEGGVRSISISLDGARAATNDAVRDGGRFDLVTANVRAAVAARRRAAIDLRLGISTVVLRSNLDELSDMVTLAADLGVDWLKLEEAVPVNAFAARSLVRVDDARLRDAVAVAEARAQSLGLVLVDHTAPPRVFRCMLEGDARMRAFLESDEFANRSVIHPCRDPWDRACVDPDGEVRVGDFFAPSVGNVADASIAELWNRPHAIAERLRAETDRPCAAGPVTCVSATRSTKASPFRIAHDPAENKAFEKMRTM
jgi:MoaA/NifB/PqqE/SkfB family radical SAM enzyme